MSLFKQIKAEQLEARKAKNAVKASLLTTLIGEIQTAVTGGSSASQVGVLNPTDEEVTKVIKKFIKNAETSLAMRQDDKTQDELNILQEYMPQPLTDGQLEAVVAAEVLLGKKEGKTGGALVGYVMKQLKTGYADRYDASKVKGLVEANG